MKKIISAFLSRSEFSVHVATLLTGSSIAQAIPLLVSPVLTRIYSPSEFGIFALFIAVSTVAGSIATLRYDMAIILPEKEKDAVAVAALGLAITVMFSVLALLSIVAFHSNFIAWLARPSLEPWLYFVPVVMFMTGLYNILNYYNSRKKNYGIIAQANIIRASLVSVVQICLGSLRFGVSGLLVGAIAASVIAYLNMLKVTISKGVSVKNIDALLLKQQAVRYKEFPKYSAPGVFVNTSAQHVSSVIISTLFSAATLGHYYLVQRILGGPSMLIGAAISQVYFRNAAEEKRESGTSWLSFRSTLLRLLILGGVMFGLASFIIEDIFALLFGENWRVAGEYGKILLPLFYIRFVSAPMMFTFIVFEKQKQYLMVNVILMCGYIVAYLLAKNLGMGVEGYLYSMSILVGGVYMGVIYMTWNISKGATV